MKKVNSIFFKFIRLGKVLSMSTALLLSSNLWSHTCSEISISKIDSISETNQLPITITSFKATPYGQMVNLEWVTASESNRYFYTAEKSLDGINFDLIDKVDGSGGTKFQIIDESPWNGVSYYRIKQTDLSGKHLYSKIVSVKLSLSKNFNFIVCPNPTAGSNLRLKMLNVPSDRILVTIYNVIGNEVYSQSVLVTSREEFMATVNLPNELHQGAYLAKIDVNNSSITKRFILQKGE